MSKKVTVKNKALPQTKPPIRPRSSKQQKESNSKKDIQQDKRSIQDNNSTKANQNQKNEQQKGTKSEKEKGNKNEHEMKESPKNAPKNDAMVLETDPQNGLQISTSETEIKKNKRSVDKEGSTCEMSPAEEHVIDFDADEEDIKDFITLTGEDYYTFLQDCINKIKGETEYDNVTVAENIKILSNICDKRGNSQDDGDKLAGYGMAGKEWYTTHYLFL